MTQKRGADKIISQGHEILAPIWNAVQEFAGRGPGQVVLRFDHLGSLREIESTKKQTF